MEAQTQTNWVIDVAHSEIQFKVRHMVISTVTGYFRKFEGGLQTQGEDLSTARVWFKADVNSVDTNSEQRDGHLKSADFFDAENHPELSFSSNSVEKTGENTYKVHGELSIRGTAKPVVLNVEHNGTLVDPWGLTRSGFHITGSINRKEYGLHWHAVTEAGGLVAGDEVKLYMNVEVTKA
jgi:polyisoprenoid-binding protein YceI